MRKIPLSLAVGLILALISCNNDEPPADDDDATAPGCGDGVVDDGEECDDGEANSDSEPDACRTLCLEPSCGDEVTDTGEECDDANDWGGDGCTPLCTAENGQLEVESNDEPAEAEAWGGETIYGAVTEGDPDCFSFSLEYCSAVEARLVGECPVPATLTLHDPDYDQLAVGVPGADGCAVLDPEEEPGARFVNEGQWTLCVHGLMDGVVPYYALEITIVAPEDAAYPVDEEDDPDGDGKPNQCDADLDGDGVDNDDDNCPDIPNGASETPLAPSADGFIRQWLSAGPYIGNDSPDDCLPTDMNLVSADDAAAEPSLGDPAGDETWTILWSLEDRIEYLDAYGHVDAPREVYNVAYIYSDLEQVLTMGMGPDDGIRVWLNGESVMEESGCQGTNVDHFTEDVTLLAGWNRLMTKVHDHGGGWGNYARFLDEGVPVTDIEISLDPSGTWMSNQTDTDGDGEGDVCDETPLG